MNKRLLLKLGLVAVLGAGLFVAWLWWMAPRTGISPYTASRIQVGMSEEEVTEIIGRPPEENGIELEIVGMNNVPMADLIAIDRLQQDLAGKITFMRNWASRKAEIVVYFGADKTVLGSAYAAREARTLREKIYRWLHLD